MLGSDIRLSVEPPEGDPYTVKVTLRTAIAFEREFKTTLAGAFSENPSIEHLCWIAWTATRESGHVVKLFDDWVAEIIDIQLEETDPDPLVNTIQATK